MEKKLTKSPNKKIAGVCGGIADYFDIDPTLVRVAYTLIACFTAIIPSIVSYIILCLIMPNNDKQELHPGAYSSRR